jgi:peptidoglycan/LPS O-acetylase OafA/YrhL
MGVLNRIKELDGLRAVAVGLVVIGHVLSEGSATLSPWSMPFRDGSLGVMIFFVLSGYLITSILFREKEKTGTIALAGFYMKRSLRILPASYFYLSVVAVLSGFSLVSVSWQQLATAYLHLWNYSAILLPAGQPAQGANILGHFWSLAIEEQFYWFWPLCLLFMRKRLTLFLLAVIILMPVFRIAHYLLVPGLRDNLTMMFHTGADPLAVGALTAIEKKRIGAFLARFRSGMFSAIVFSLFCAVPIIHHFAEGKWLITYGRTIESALAAALILILVNEKDFWLSRLLRLPPFQFFGAISFSLYLWQQAFCFPNSVLTLPPLWAIAASILAATGSYYLIEQPFQRLRPAGLAFVDRLFGSAGRGGRGLARETE